MGLLNIRLAFETQYDVKLKSYRILLPSIMTRKVLEKTNQNTSICQAVLKFL
jgi:hypothetical protein